MNVQRIDKEEDLEYLQGQWRGLVEANAPFWMQYEWFYYWWKARSEKLKLSVYLVQEGGKSIMIAPWVSFMDSQGRMILRFPANDFPNELIGSAMEGLPILFNHLSVNTQYHRIWLRHIRDNTSTAKALSVNLFRERLLIESANDSPYITLSRDWQTYASSLPVNLKKTIRNKQNRLRKQGQMSIRCFSGEGEVDEGINKAFLASAKSWQGKNGSAISSPGQREFYEVFSKVAAEKEWLQLYILECDDKPIAFEYNLIHGKTAYSLKWGFDSDFHAFSPGALLKYESTQNYFMMDYSEIDLLGASDFFKLRWTREIRYDSDYTIYGPGIKNLVDWVFRSKLLPFFKRFHWNNGGGVK